MDKECMDCGYPLDDLKSKRCEACQAMHEYSLENPIPDEPIKERVKEVNLKDGVSSIIVNGELLCPTSTKIRRTRRYKSQPLAWNKQYVEYVESRKEKEISDSYNGKNKCKCGGNVYFIPEENSFWCVNCGLKRKSGIRIYKEKLSEKRYNAKCEECGEEYETSEEEVRNGRKFCSKECKNANRKGENSPSWLGGKSYEPYCPKFNEFTKNKVRNYFNKKCVVCGKTQKENKRKLAVHHVNYDKGQGCSGEWLLVPLCNSCHSKTNHNRDYWEEYFTNFLAQNNFECGVKVEKRICPTCCDEFIPEHGNQKYCSENCRTVAKSEMDETHRHNYHVKYRKNGAYINTLLGSVV